MGRFAQLGSIVNEAVTSVTSTKPRNGYKEEESKSLIIKGSIKGVTNVTTVTTKRTEEGLQSGAGVAVATRDVSRAKMPYEPTHKECGMIRCMDCRHWNKRCRHPTLYGGHWPELHKDRWRRCAEYEERADNSGSRYKGIYE